ncbi:MAG TPA: heme-binding protein [Candidatus Methylacidiphilales bacterium]|nr:heme-binding protein [Candidatus Methylacidiphilales bacterium]
MPTRQAERRIPPNHLFAITAFLALASAGHAFGAPSLALGDVNTILGQAAQAAATYSPNSVIAVTDREGFVLGVYGVSGPPTATQTANAIAKAGTAAFLSSGGEAFTSRTAGYIIQPHFPPGISNTSPGPLVGVGFSSLPFSDINHFRNPANPAIGIPGTSLSGNPGGVPLYEGGILVGGVGVDSGTTPDALNFVPGPDIDENIAVMAQSGYGPPSSILATQVLINGIRLPYTDFTGGSAGTAALIPGNFDPAFPATASPGAPFQAGLLPYNTNPLTQTAIPILPVPSPLSTISGGEVRDPIIASPIATPVNGQPRLSQAEVTTILYQAAVRAAQTRGAIRNPLGSAAEVFIVVIDYYNTTGAGVPVAPDAPLPPPSTAPYAFPRPQVLGSFRTPDATIFSYDVAAQKARTALFFSNNTMALSSRAVGFLAQSTYPPGIDGTAAGPYYLLQNALSQNPIPPATPNANASVNPFLPNGITIFPGGFPLYRNGVLIGAIGVSGDGVDQDDLISAAGTVGFEAPTAIRADEYTYRGARLPYAKFPQNASL